MGNLEMGVVSAKGINTQQVDINEIKRCIIDQQITVTIHKKTYDLKVTDAFLVSDNARIKLHNQFSDSSNTICGIINRDGLLIPIFDFRTECEKMESLNAGSYKMIILDLTGYGLTIHLGIIFNEIIDILKKKKL